MIKTVNARFTNGVLTPLEPLDFEEGVVVVVVSIELAQPDPESPQPRFRVTPNHSGLVPGIDPAKLNQLSDELAVEDHLRGCSA